MKRMKGINSLSGAVLRTASLGSRSADDHENSKRKAGSSQSSKHLASDNTQIYTAPSLDGGDDEYKKLISGKVDNNKPSFA